MKLADYVVKFLEKEGIKHIFLISGGAVAHLVDAVARNLNIKYICTQHEQGGGAAADAYARINENLGAAMVTSGPGATNLVTSVCNSYFDSIPTIFICGQVATSRLRPNEQLRQKGFQETDVISIFKSITKYALQLRKAEDIQYELEKCVYLAREGRPGPVLIDIPDDLQRVDIDPNKLKHFSSLSARGKNPPSGQIKEVFSFVESAKRPVLILGAGIRIAQAQKEAIQFARYLHLPILLTWGGMDLMAYDDPLNMGGLGVCGPRGGNFAAQHCDLVIAIGTRLSHMITGGKQNLFAPKAKKVMIDIDSQELTKFTASDLSLDLAVESSIPKFFKTCQDFYKNSSIDRFNRWRKQIQLWREKYPICPSEYYNRKEKVDSYVFIKELSQLAEEGDIIITDAGGNLSWTMQAFEVKKDQRLFSAWNHSPMGYSLPASIGAALAGSREVICIIGDGGIMMCIQELATIKRHNLPVKIFIFNNHGHGIQKQTIDTWLNSNYAAVDEATGLSFPDFAKVAEAFGLPYCHIEHHRHLKEKLKEVLKAKGPVLCDVEIVKDQKIVPMLKFGAGLEDLDPKLSREEIAAIERQAEAFNQQRMAAVGVRS